MNSLRWKLIVGILTGITLLLAVGGAVAYLNTKERLRTEFDRSLVQRAVSLAAMIEEEAGRLQIGWLEIQNNPPGHLAGIDYYSVWKKENGEVVTASLDMNGEGLPRFGGPLAKPELRDIILPGNRSGRCVGIEFEAHRGLPGVIDDDDEPGIARAGDEAKPQGPLVVQLVIAKADTVAPTLAAIQRSLIGLWAGCTALGGLIIWWIVRRGLRPLEQLKAQIGGLEEGVAGQRIVLARQPAELEPVTRELNCLLERIEKTLVRERTLTSNVAHELRTPIAGLLSTLEVTLSRLRSPEQYRESTQECFDIAKRMHWLVNNLLSITRIEAGNVQLHNQLVTIENTLPEWWRPFAPRAEDRGLRVAWELEPGAQLETDPEFLRVVVTNLFDNAVSYTPEGGTICIGARSDGTISVANQAVDLNAEVIEHVFDPFWRNSGARDGDGAHAGLGLSLCKKIIELLGGRISAWIKEPERVFVVRLEMACSESRSVEPTVASELYLRPKVRAFDFPLGATGNKSAPLN